MDKFIKYKLIWLILIGAALFTMNFRIKAVEEMQQRNSAQYSGSYTFQYEVEGEIQEHGRTTPLSVQAEGHLEISTDTQWAFRAMLLTQSGMASVCGDDDVFDIVKRQDGAIQRIAYDRGTASTCVAVYREMMGLMQICESESGASWDCLETVSNGRAEFNYDSSDERLTKTLTSIAKPDGGRLAASGAVEWIVDRLGNILQMEASIQHHEIAPTGQVLKWTTTLSIIPAVKVAKQGASHSIRLARKSKTLREPAVDDLAGTNAQIDLEIKAARTRIGDRTLEDVVGQIDGIAIADDPSSNDQMKALNLAVDYLRVNPEASFPFARRAAEFDADDRRFFYPIGALVYAGHTEAQQALQELMRRFGDDEPKKQGALVGKLNDLRQIEENLRVQLWDVAEHSNIAALRVMATFALGSTSGEDEISEFAGRYESGDLSQRVTILSALGNTSLPGTLAVASAASNSEFPREREAAADMLRSKAGEKFEALILKLAQDVDESTRLNAVKSFKAIERDDHSALELAKRYDVESSGLVRSEIVAALAKYPLPGVIVILEKALEDVNPEVQRAAVQAVRTVSQATE